MAEISASASSTYNLTSIDNFSTLAFSANYCFAYMQR
jgi:hypothetical protein